MGRKQNSTSKRFQPKARYQFGILKKDTDPTSPTPEFVGKAATYHGSFFLSMGIHTVGDYVERNPHGLPAKTFTFYVVQPDGTRQYFDEGTPALHRPQVTLADSQLMQVPVPSPSLFTSPLPQPAVDARSNQDIEFLQNQINRLHSANAEKDALIYSLQQKLQESLAQAAEYKKSYEAAEHLRKVQQQIHETEMRIRTSMVQSNQPSGLSGLVDLAKQLLPAFLPNAVKATAESQQPQPPQQSPNGLSGYGRGYRLPSGNPEPQRIQYDQVEVI